LVEHATENRSVGGSTPSPGTISLSADIRRQKCGDKPYKVADMYGLYLLMHPNGARYWRFD
jgi:hypothetical protein